MAEEEIIKKRLAVEGDGGGDDRRIMSLLKTFVRWCNTEQLGDEESEATYQKMLFTLGKMETSMLCLWHSEQWMIYIVPRDCYLCTISPHA